MTHLNAYAVPNSAGGRPLAAYDLVPRASVTCFLL